MKMALVDFTSPWRAKSSMTPRLCGAVNLPERDFQKGRLDTVEIAHAFLNSENFLQLFSKGWE